MTFEELQKANSTINTVDVKGKNYAEVNQRIKAFRMVYPNGAIVTELLSNENGMCIFKATVLDDERLPLGTGTAYEKEGSTFINKTSYIENCETSAVGRALGMCGFGIDTSVASYEEVSNAIKNQEQTKQRDKRLDEIEDLAQDTGTSIAKLESYYKVKMLDALTDKQIEHCLDALRKKAIEQLGAE